MSPKRICISREQRDLHVASEAAALAGVPILFWIAAKHCLPTWAGLFAAGLGIGTLVVDGALLASYLDHGPQKRRRKQFADRWSEYSGRTR